MLIGEASRRSGVPAHTIRFYEDQRLVSRAARTRAGYRVYAERVLGELLFIKRAQRLGFTLDQTREILGLGRAGRTPCERVAAMCAEHLAEIDRRLSELHALRRHLKKAERDARRGCGLTADGFCRAVLSASGDHALRGSKSHGGSPFARGSVQT